MVNLTGNLITIKYTNEWGEFNLKLFTYQWRSRKVCLFLSSSAVSETVDVLGQAHSHCLITLKPKHSD